MMLIHGDFVLQYVEFIAGLGGKQQVINSQLINIKMQTALLSVH